MDEQEVRDTAEEAANAGAVKDEQAAEASTDSFPYRVELQQFDPTSEGIVLLDDGAEVDFVVEPKLWPRLRQEMETAYQEWLAKQV